MIRQSPPELFGQRPIRSDYVRQQRGGRINMFRVFILVGLLAAAIGGGFALSSLGDNSGAPEEIPHITAQGPIKEKPENPGGIDIPHQDVQVFSALDAKSNPTPDASKIEHLLPAPETPQPIAMDAKQSEAPQNTQTEVLSSTTPPKEEDLPPPITEATPVQPAIEKAEPAAPEIKKAAEPIKVDKPAQIIKKATAPKATPPIKKVEPKKVDEVIARLPAELFTSENPVVPQAAATKAVETPPAPTGKSVKVQLASLPSQADAQKLMQKLQSQHAATLAGTTLNVVKAEISGKGTYYRVMSSPLSETQAKSICADLSKKKQACLVAR